MRTAVEAPRGVIWNLDGPQLAPWQAADRLYQGGFTDPLLLGEACSVMKAESGWYLKAWHINPVYDQDGRIFRDPEDGKMTVKSVDLGFIQRNVTTPNTRIDVTQVAAQALVDGLFKANPKLAKGVESAKIAFQLYQQRGWSPWYAWVNGYSREYLDDGALAVGNLVSLRWGQGGFLLAKTEPVSFFDGE